MTCVKVLLLGSLTCVVPCNSASHKKVNTRENFWNIYCFMTNQMWDEIQLVFFAGFHITRLIDRTLLRSMTGCQNSRLLGLGSHKGQSLERCSSTCMSLTWRKIYYPPWPHTSMRTTLPSWPVTTLMNSLQQPEIFSGAHSFTKKSKKRPTYSYLKYWQWLQLAALYCYIEG